MSEEYSKNDKKIQDPNFVEDSSKDSSKKSEAIKLLLEQLESTNLASDKTPAGSQKHLFWDSQPVPKQDVQIKKDGPLHDDIPIDKVPNEPIELPEGYEWCLVNIHNEKEMTELYTLLSKNYVEDSDELFRFHYTPEFLKWGLDPPNQNPEWHLGIRVKNKKRQLIGFISGLQVEMRVKETYFHRPLNPKKLVESGFSRLPPGMTMSRLVNKFKVISDTSAQLPGMRPIKEKDIPQVRKLLNKYLNSRSKMHQVFSTDELAKHWLLPRDNVVYSYVVEDVLKPGKVTDFFSFYLLPSTVLKSSSTDKGSHLINSAYLFYYATNPEPASGLKPESGESFKQLNDSKLKERLLILMYNCLMLAKKENLDVLNCVNVLDNGMIIDDLKFGQGDGKLHYYFYNYVVNGLKPNDVGLTML
ncbi:Glycylpeptide N-tetradecanoyltransferase [Smittium mucronatum]|uniref:Glycylpeptide N-tetradecanoyltransferase n=1 Tax=Smittium mucronatum TaxID=133383 RepID=A0A1R0GW88_9FUNG|nr:Glycylpeptide N-tetradecanoyltransferase [Smittium mucronatum]